MRVPLNLRDISSIYAFLGRSTSSFLHQRIFHGFQPFYHSYHHPNHAYHINKHLHHIEDCVPTQIR